jgi:hypothetical protein
MLEFPRTEDREAQVKFKADLRKKNSEGFYKGQWQWNQKLKLFYVKEEKGQWELVLFNRTKYHTVGRVRLPEKTRYMYEAILVYREPDGVWTRTSTVFLKSMRGEWEASEKKGKAEKSLASLLLNGFGIELDRYKHFNF